MDKRDRSFGWLLILVLLAGWTLGGCEEEFESQDAGVKDGGQDAVATDQKTDRTPGTKKQGQQCNSADECA